MKKTAVILLMCILLFCGCSGEPASLDNSAALPLEDGATEITVEVIDYNGFYDIVAKEFEKETGIKVHVKNNTDINYRENPDYRGSMPDFVAIEKRINTELMAGKGADIYANVPLIQYYSLGEQGLLCDMANWISADPDINADNYYMNIININECNGKTYVLTASFIMERPGSDVRIPGLDGKVGYTWEEFFEAAKDIESNGTICGMTDIEIFEKRYLERKTEFINEEEKTHQLDSPEMMKILTQCKEWAEQGLCNSIKKPNGSGPYNAPSYQIYSVSRLLSLININTEESNVYFYNMPTNSTDTQYGEIFRDEHLYINAASKAKGTAWKFIKFILSERVQSEYLFLDLPVDRIPVNKGAVEVQAEKELSDIQKEGIRVNKEQAKQDILDALEAIDRSAGIDAVSKMSKKPYEYTILDEAARYYMDEITAEEAIQNMTNKVELYFKEQE